MNKVILEINNLKTYFHLEEGTLKAVDDISFKITNPCNSGNKIKYK